jgi:hypothetical protein
MLDTLFTYVTGDEYQDIQAAWDWNLLPGTTTLLDKPALSCEKSRFTGNRSFVGGASDGWVGTQAVDFLDPFDGSLSYRKVRHYFDDSVLVTISKVDVQNSSSPVITVLDQTHLSDAPIELDGQPWKGGDGTAQAKTLWHAGNGFIAYDQAFDLNITASNRTGNWSAISTSTAGVSTTAIFNAFATIPSNLKDEGFSYAMYPAVDKEVLAFEAENPTTFPLSLGSDITAAVAPSRLSLVFWKGGQTASLPLKYLRPDANPSETLTIKTDAACILLVTGETQGKPNPRKVYLTVADPTQQLATVTVQMSIGTGMSRRWQPRRSRKDVSVTIELPQGGYAGDSVEKVVKLW